MQKLRVDILKGIRFQGTKWIQIIFIHLQHQKLLLTHMRGVYHESGASRSLCFESYRHMLPSCAWTPDAHKSTFRIMRENPYHTAM